MKIGIELRIDVTKIDKHRIYNGKKGKYLTMTAFVDLDNKDQYGNNGMITHKKEEGEESAPILGNSKVFWSDSGDAAPHANRQPPAPHGAAQYQQNASAPHAAQSHSNQGHGGYQNHPPTFEDDSIPF